MSPTKKSLRILEQVIIDKLHKPIDFSKSTHKRLDALDKTVVLQKRHYRKALDAYGANIPRQIKLTPNQNQLLEEIFSKNNNRDLKHLEDHGIRTTHKMLGKSKFVIECLKEHEDIAILVPSKKRKLSIIRILELTEKQSKRIIVIKRLKEKT